MVRLAPKENMANNEIKVATLNAWGMLYISSDVEARMISLADQLALGEYDIVTLQELWSDRHFDMICEKVKSVLPYSIYFHSGTVGSGCATFSKYPFVDSFFIQYKFGGNCWDVFGGDWFAGKGLGCVVVKHPLKNIHIFNTHLHASYSYDPYFEVRTLQTYQASSILKHVARADDAVIFCGDFNHTPDELGIKALTTLTGLKDTYEIAGKKPEECYTLNCKTNKYVPYHEPLQRIDYTFVSRHFVCTQADLALQTDANGLHYSDHEGYATTLKFHPDCANDAPPNGSSTTHILQQLYTAVSAGESLVKRVYRRTLLLIVLLVFFLLTPVLSERRYHAIFPSVHTFTGKLVFLAQLASAAFIASYVWILLILRKIDGNAFKDTCKEIKILLDQQAKEKRE